jgi:hypothetical protein
MGVPQILGIFGGMVLLAWAATGFKTGAANEQIAMKADAVATAAPMPTMVVTAVATAQPVSTAQPVATRQLVVKPVAVESYPEIPSPLSQGSGTATGYEVVATLLKVAIGILAIATAWLWGYAAVTIRNRRRRVNALRGKMRVDEKSLNELKGTMERTGTYTREPDAAVWKPALDKIPDQF